MKFTNKFQILLITALLVPTLVFSQDTRKSIAGVSLERLERYEAYVNSEIEQGNIPGAVSLIHRRGEKVYSSALGYSSLSDKRKIEETDLFFIQSMTKPIITVAFMTLYEEGHFQLTDPVSKYIPAFKDITVAKDKSAGLEGGTIPLDRDITIAHLLSHTAGFSHGLGGSKLDREVNKNQYQQDHENIQARVDNLITLPLVGQPEEQWYYSAAPDVISVLIEHFSGIPTDKYLKEKIFEPLGMNDTGYNVPKKDQSRVVQLHAHNDAEELEVTEYQPPTSKNKIWSGVNGLFSTVADYMKFSQMMMNGGELNGVRIIGRKTVEMMTLDQSKGLFGGAGEVFGFGFAILQDVEDSRGLGTPGLFHWGGAFNTHFYIDPKEELVAIFMTQTAVYDGYYHQMLRQLIYQAIVD